MVRKEGKLKLLPEGKSNSIDYIPVDREQTVLYTTLLMKEMRLQGRSTLRKNLNQI